MDDPFTNAVCRQTEHRAATPGGVLWDYRIDNETDAQRLHRYQQAVTLCQQCPNMIDRSCEREHQWIEERYGEHSGVWAGVVHDPGAPTTGGLLRLI